MEIKTSSLEQKEKAVLLRAFSEEAFQKLKDEGSITTDILKKYISGSNLEKIIDVVSENDQSGDKIRTRLITIGISETPDSYDCTYKKEGN